MQMRTLEDWVDSLGKAEVPVLRHSLRTLTALRTQGSRLDVKRVAEVVALDPLLTVRLLRFIQLNRHASQRQELIDVKQALMMLGLDAFYDRLVTEPTVEQCLAGWVEALTRLLETVRRAQRAARLAYDWALRLQDLHADEVWVAALLAHSAEMLMWGHHPEGMLTIRRLQRAQPHARSAAIQQQVLGFPGVALQRRLNQAWGLPALLVDVFDPDKSQNGRVRIVQLAVAVARHAANGWDDPALPDDYRAVGQILQMNPDQARNLIRQVGA